MNKNKIIIPVGIVLVLLLAGVTYLLLSEKKTNRELVQEFELEKEDLENQYTTFARQYDELKMTVSNDSLSSLLEQEQLKTQRLLEELARQKEIIDDVTQKYHAASATISNLSEEKKALDQKVTLAAQLDATAITVTPLNKRSRKTKRIKNIVKLKIDFTISKNITAETGERTLYVRIMKPDNDVLTKNATDTFPYENRQLRYSIKKYIEYNGEEQPVTVYWDVEEFLYAGNYRIDIFADGTLIGTQDFTLD